MHGNSAAVVRLKAVAEADPGALVRTLQFFQARNLVPRRVSSQRLGDELLEIAIEVDASACAQEAFRLIVAKMSELPIVLAVVVCDD